MQLAVIMWELDNENAQDIGLNSLAALDRTVWISKSFEFFFCESFLIEVPQRKIGNCKLDLSEGGVISILVTMIEHFVIIRW